MPSSIDLAVQKVASALGAVAAVLESPTGPGDMLALLGWDTPPGAADIGLASIDLSDLVAKVSALDLAISIGTTGLELDAQFAEVGVALASFLQGIDAVVNDFAAIPDYLTKTNVVAEFVPRLLDFAVLEALKTTSLITEGAALFLGVAELRYFPADPTIYQVEHVRRIVHWDRIPQIFGDIRGLLAAIYAWGTANFDPTPVLVALGSMLSGLGVSVSVRPLPRQAEHALTGSDAPEADTNPMTQAMLSFVRGLDWGGIDLGISIIALRPSSPGGTDAGVAVAPYAHGGAELQYPLSDTLTFSFDASLDVNAGIALIFRAGSGASLRTNLTAGGLADVVSGNILVKLAYADPQSKPVPLLTVADGLGIQVGSITIGGGVDISSGLLSALVTFELDNGAFQVSTAHMDSFLASLIPLDVNVGFNLKLGWSSAHGLFIEGNVSPRFDIAVNQSIGPFTIGTVHIALTLGQPDLPLEISLDGSGALGPLGISVQRLGVTADLAFTRGNLGPVDLSLGLKPPTGLGIQIDAGLAAGGGFISYDANQGRYAGVLDVTLADVVSVKVIAVLDTKLPDGSSGFSFLLIITFDFPPVQLGFGFTINGVGGLGGVNRTMVIDALQAGLRAHTLDNILFPQDPVDNAPQIISEIESFFPPAQGRYLFGPMFSIGWGTPTLLDLEVGVILEVPDPIRLAILGEILATIPSPDFALISLKIQVLGTIDFGLQKLAIDGTMYDSYLLAFQLAGDMALRLTWGDNPDFLFSLGGFNPHFQPPPGVPALNRLSVSIGAGDNPRLSATSYFAVTSNSLQFGANVDAYAAAGGFSVHGYIGFDTLFIFSPFSFEIDFSAGFDISFQGASLAGIQLDASLSGPRPWHLHGDASFHILFFDVSASIDLTWGDSTPATLPSAPVLPPLTAALGDSRNWSAALPPTGNPGVSLRSIPADPTQIVVQPGGVLSVREIIVPLDIPITKFNNATPADGNEFSITSVTLNGTAVATVPKQEDFAIAQFTDMSDADKLSAPSYEPFDAGVSLGAVPIQNGHDSARTVAYQERYIDDYTQISRFGRIYQMPGAVHAALANCGAASVRATATTGLAAFATRAPSPLSVTTMRYVVASTLDLTQRTDILPAATTHFQALATMSAFLDGNPGQRDTVQVIPEHEAVS